MPTKTPQSPQNPSDRHLSVVHDSDPRNKGQSSRNRKLAAAVMAVALSGAAVFGATRGTEPQTDQATEQNEAVERNLLAPLFKPEAVMPYMTELGEVSQLKGSATISIKEQNGKTPFGINVRSTPFQQRADSANMFTEDNVMVSVGNPASDDEAVRTASTLTMVNPIVVTAENGTQWYGGIVTKPGEEVPLADATSSQEAFAASFGWVNVTELSDPYSGADVGVRSGQTEKSIESFADPNIDGGPYMPQIPVAYIDSIS